MSINKRLMLSSTFNHTWPKYLHTNQTNRSSDTSNTWIINRLTIVQRAFFILSIIILFWIIFVIIYISSRLILRWLSNWKPFQTFYYESPSISNEKISRAVVISSNHYGSFWPTYIPSPLLRRSDSLFSTNTEQNVSQQSLNMISSTTNKTSLLEHYLKTYNPLKLDLTSSIVKDIVVEQAASDTDTRPINNCYAWNCTNKQKRFHGGRYVRLIERENCSATISDRLSDCSTKLTSVTLPMVMVTDCSDSQRLHTDIIELNEDEKDKE